jgi:hypothetical protein
MTLACPRCGKNLSVLDVGKEFVCPSCSAKLRSRGFGLVLAFEVGAFAVFGGLAIWLFQSSQTVLALVILVGWAIADVYVRRSILSLHMENEERG